MDSFKNIIKTYRQKFTNVATEIYKVSVTKLYLFNFLLPCLIILIAVFRLKYWLDVININVKS